MEGGVDDNNVNVDDDDAGMEGGVDDNNVNVDDDVCGENNKGESDCGEGENKDEVGDDDEDMGEDLFLCLFLMENPAIRSQTKEYL